jgi:hypothetical protein
MENAMALVTTNQTAQFPRRSSPPSRDRPRFGAQRGEVTSVERGTPWWTSLDSSASDDRMDPDLEVWVDERATPVIIRMTGVLDSSTNQSLLSLMEQLLVEGKCHFIVDAGEVEIGDAWGASALTVFQRRTREAGGSLTWEGVDFGPPRCGSAKVSTSRRRWSSRRGSGKVPSMWL